MMSSPASTAWQSAGLSPACSRSEGLLPEEQVPGADGENGAVDHPLHGAAKDPPHKAQDREDTDRKEYLRDR